MGFTSGEISEIMEYTASRALIKCEKGPERERERERERVPTLKKRPFKKELSCLGLGL